MKPPTWAEGLVGKDAPLAAPRDIKKRGPSGHYKKKGNPILTIWCMFEPTLGAVKVTISEF